MKLNNEKSVSQFGLTSHVYSGYSCCHATQNCDAEPKQQARLHKG